MKIGPAGRYTRGWETFGHYLTMLKSSIKLHVGLSLALALVVGTSWFLAKQNENFRQNVGQYVKASVLSTIKKNKKSEYNLNGEIVRISSKNAYEHLKINVFGGRSVTYLLKQVAFRVLISGMIFGLLSLWLVTALGHRMEKDRHKRGAIVLDVEQENIRVTRRKRVSLVVGCLALGGLAFIIIIGEQGRKNLDDYFWASTFTSLPSMARLACPDDACEYAWYDNPTPNFQKSEEVLERGRSVFFGFSLFQILILYLALSVVFGAVHRSAGYLLGRYAYLFEEFLSKAKGWRWAEKWSKWVPFSCVVAKDKGFELAGIALKPGTECQHFLFNGAPSCGKSTGIKEVADQVRERGQRAIVYDPSGEYIAKYFREGIDVILNPLDERSAIWNLWADIRERSDYWSIAHSLFPKEGKDPFWSETSRLLFSAVAEKLASVGRKSNSALHKMLTQAPTEDLAAFLKGTDAARILSPKAGAAPENVLMTIVSKVACWSVLPDVMSPKDAFSIRDFIENERHDSWLFLSMRSDQEANLRPLVSLWCDIASTAILSLAESRERRFWVFLDEIASLQRLPALEPLMSRGRKYGAAVVLGLQSRAQLRDSYGRDATDALLSQPQTWMVMRTTEPDTAQWLEKALGEAEIFEARESVSMGADSFRDGVSLAENIRKQSVAMAAEIGKLEDCEGFLNVPGVGPVYRVRLQIKRRRDIAEVYIPRRKLQVAI